MTSSLALWRDRKGRLSGLRAVTLALLVFPVVLATADAARGALGGRPINELIHRSGWWALVLLLASLAVTPLRRSARFGRLIDVRRMIGVASFVYAIVHLTLYVVDQKFDLLKVATEIVVRTYLTIGFLALLGLAALAVTSNDTMVRRIGGLRWRRLHQVAYAITLLALVHFFQQTKADITVPTLYAGLFGWLMGYRLLARWRGEGALTPAWLVLLALAAGAVTLVAEAVGIGIAFGVSPMMILGTAFDVELGIRPGWSVMAAGLAIALLDTVRGLVENRGRTPAPRPRAAPAE